MLNLQIDSHKKRIWMEVELKGESEPIRIEVGRYELEERDNKSYLVVKELQASREWIDILAKSYFDGYAIEIPSQLAKALKVFV